MQLRPLARAFPELSRPCSNVVYGPDSGQLQEIIDRNLSKEGKVAPPTLLTTRREALGLMYRPAEAWRGFARPLTPAHATLWYREILRYSRLFVWNDETGKPWRDVLRNSARQEFETTRHHTDPELVTRLIVTGRDSVQRITEKFMKKRQDIIAHEVKRTGPPP